MYYFIAGNVFAKMFGQIVCIRVKKRSKTNVLVSGHFQRYKALLPVQVRRSKTPLHKLLNV